MPFVIAESKFQIENLRFAICDSERSEDEGGPTRHRPIDCVRKGLTRSTRPMSHVYIPMNSLITGGSIQRFT
jgi:hypothetical protein